MFTDWGGQKVSDYCNWGNVLRCGKSGFTVNRGTVNCGAVNPGFTVSPKSMW